MKSILNLIKPYYIWIVIILPWLFRHQTEFLMVLIMKLMKIMKLIYLFVYDIRIYMWYKKTLKNYCKYFWTSKFLSCLNPLNFIINLRIIFSFFTKKCSHQKLQSYTRKQNIFLNLDMLKQIWVSVTHFWLI